ncbi:MAG: cation:proton antiporter [Synechococcales cyanobacterium]
MTVQILLATADTPPLSELAPFVLVAVLLSLVTIYLASQLLGELASRLGFPSVLGELAGGVLIGGSLLGLLVFPESSAGVPSHLMEFLQWTTGLGQEAIGTIFSTESEVIDVLAEIGVVILLFEIGLESDLQELIRVGPQAASVAVIGVAVPFAAGTAGLVYFFGVPLVPAIFAGAALTATSIGITARVLAELQKLSSPEGQIIIGAAVLDDILGIIILAVVASLARTGEVQLLEVGKIILSAVVFLLGAIVVGRLLSPYLVGIMKRMKTRGSPLIPALVVAFVLGYVGQVIGLEAILGAFAAGLILAETEKQGELEEKIRPIADLFVPIFFVSVGAKTNLSVFDPSVPANREGMIIAVFLIGVAIIGKIFAGLGVFGRPEVDRYAVGVGMIPRGEVGLVFAGVGAASGVLSDALNTSIILMVIVTTFVAPLWLRSALNRAPRAAAVVDTSPDPSLADTTGVASDQE